MSTISICGTSRLARGHSIETYLGGLLLGIMVAVIFLQIIARYVFGASLSWSEELARYCFIWLTFLTLGAVVVKAQHIVIDSFTSRLPKHAQRVWELILQMIIVVLNIIIMVYGVILIIRMASLGQTSAALQLPMWVVYAALPVGLALASLRAVQVGLAIWRIPSDNHNDFTAEETEA